MVSKGTSVSDTDNFKHFVYLRRIIAIVNVILSKFHLHIALEFQITMDERKIFYFRSWFQCWNLWLRLSKEFFPLFFSIKS